MARNKKKEEERKQRREEMAKKYPVQNPRANVSTVVTGKNVPRAAVVWNKQDAASYEPAINRDVNAHTKRVPYPLRVEKYEPKKQTWQSATVQSARSKAVRKAIEDRENRNKAATGWQQYQIDEANKRLSRADPAFQRWKAQFGEDGLDDAFYKPAKNWSVDANNTFGYLYREDKEKAYRFAKTLNKAYKQPDEAFSEQSGGLEAKRAEAGLETANTVTDWLKELDLGEKLKTAWEHHGEAQKSYGEAMKQQSENTADTAKRLWEKHKTNVGAVASAQAQQAQAQTKRLGEAANSEIAQRVTNTFTEAMRRQSSNAEKVAEQWEDNAYLAGKYSGVTGSDQTGASIHGFRDDTSYKTPNENWTSGERQLYEQHLKNNPKEAEEYAIRTNDRHNQKKKDEKKQAVDDWMSQSAGHGAAAWAGARGLNQISGIDGYNKMLEYAAIGRNNVSKDLSASDFVETVDDVNERNISDRYGEEAGAAYRIGTDATDAIISRGINYLPVAKLPNGDKIRLNDVNEAIGAFNESYLGARNNGLSGLESVELGTVNAGVDFLLGKFTERLSKESFDEKDVARVFMEEPINAAVGNVGVPGSKKWFEANDSEIQERKGKYMKEKGVSERRAWWMATKELLQESMNGKTHP